MERDVEGGATAGEEGLYETTEGRQRLAYPMEKSVHWKTGPRVRPIRKDFL